MATNSLSAFTDFMPDVDWNNYILEKDPKMAYFSAAPFSGATSPMQNQYWQGQFGNVYNQYTGSVGRQLQSGQEPTSFVDYLSQTPFTERYTSLSPTMRPGSATRRYNPGTRYMYS